MSKDHYWRAISIDSISPELFPKVALYLNNGGNYVMYKDADWTFTPLDKMRLQKSNTDFLYVRSGDMELLNDFMENSLTDLLARGDLSSSAKGKILYQTSVNCVIDMFESPETASNITRGRNMVQHILRHVSSDPHALQSLQTVIDQNFYLFAHAVQVTTLSLLTHEKLFDLQPDELIDVGVGSLLHDYGMIFITSEVLEKNGSLSDIEYHKIKQHTQKGYEYLKKCGNYNETVLGIVRYHHERFDGNGYPVGSTGNDIPRSAQVTGICDVYSALIMDRAYRKANSHADAILMMHDEADSGAYNPELFGNFVEILKERNSP